MPKRKQNKCYLTSVCADHIKNGQYELSEPYDFDEWHNLIKNNKASDRQEGEKDLRFVLHFIDMVQKGESPNNEVMQFLALCFTGVINDPTHRWEDSFLMPWSEISVHMSRSELIDLELYGEVTEILEAFPGYRTTKAIKQAADKWHTSYEKARAAYYKYKK
jgi:hypothetical protein